MDIVVAVLVIVKMPPFEVITITRSFAPHHH